ncbi:MAG: zinc finger domain-containing protein [Dehalococcoidales bacterium]|jgi:DnaJ-class molecular chaperone
MPEIIDCPRCKGTGKIKERLNPLSTAMVEVKCPDCKGTGKVDE